jgi:hypothetical protein
MKGFTSISHVHQTLHKYPYQGSSVLPQEQRDDWVDGMRRRSLLEELPFKKIATSGSL